MTTLAKGGTKKRIAQQREMAAFAGSQPNDWKYIAEGALNLALRYAGDDDALRGMVLRVRKDNPEAAGGKREANPWQESLAFVDKMVVPLLGRRYVQPAVEVPLREGFMKELGALIESDRPEKRRKHPLDADLKTGLLMLDNTAIPMGEGPSICFELKVKCGFIPDKCPFVTHEVKRRVDRFTMHQQLKNAQGKLDTVSQYSPLDLFSYDEGRVKKALHALVETPQNNFRMFVDGAMVYPDDKGHGSVESLEGILSQHPSIQGGVSHLVDTLATLLVREPLLARVRTMQMMDDCDIEGTWPAFQAIEARNEVVVPLAEGETLLPREPPSQAPSTPEEQHETVRRFMLSCTGKDCSAMIVLKPGNAGTSSSDAPGLRDAAPETDPATPRAVVNHGDYMYSVAVVDLDPKPLAKMQHYYELDKKIAEHYAATVQK